MDSDILHIEPCNFIDKPIGGQLNFSRQLLKVFGNRLALVGLTSTASEPIGSWFKKTIDGKKYNYFAIGRIKLENKKPIVPARLKTWFQIKRYQNRILSVGIPNILIREHSIIMALKKRDNNLCFYNPGVDSALSISRYSWAKYFSSAFDYLFYNSMCYKTQCILAAADESAIDEMKKRAGNLLFKKNIIPFPTRVDTEIYHPAETKDARSRLGLRDDMTIVVTVGRIHWAKGWQLLLDSFKQFLDQVPNSLLIFIGDGVERDNLLQKVSMMGLKDSVIVAGYQPPPAIATYLQASDLFVMGSLKEGWSTALVEAMASHLPIVTTQFSSADTIVKNGVNGFIVNRDPFEFSNAMKQAIHLPYVDSYSKREIKKYALMYLGDELLKVWQLAEAT